MSKKERSLANYITLHHKWKECFSGKDRNSICQQLYNLIWNTAVYRIINESRKYTKTDSEEYENNGVLHLFIDDCFSEYQFITIRRLLDKNNETTYSLYGLLTDMEANSHLINRYNFLTSHGLEYDVQMVRDKYEKFLDEQAKLGSRSFFIPPDLIWEHNEQRHCEFDKLSNTNAANRQENNTINVQVFQNLKGVLDKLEPIIIYAHKFYAHLSTTQDRTKNNIEDIKITLGQLWDAHEKICKVATFLGKYFFDGCSTFLGIVQFDQFNNIDKPFVETQNISELREKWDEYLKETDSWSDFDLNQYEEFIKESP